MSSTDNTTTFAKDELKSYVSRVQRLEEEIKSLNEDKRDLYAEAKSRGFDVKALKAVIAYLRKDPYEAEEQDSSFRVYLDAIQGKSDAGIDRATRVRVRDHSGALA